MTGREEVDALIAGYGLEKEAIWPIVAATGRGLLAAGRGIAAGARALPQAAGTAIRGARALPGAMARAPGALARSVSEIGASGRQTAGVNFRAGMAGVSPQQQHAGEMGGARWSMLTQGRAGMIGPRPAPQPVAPSMASEATSPKSTRTSDVRSALTKRWNTAPAPRPRRGGGPVKPTGGRPADMSSIPMAAAGAASLANVPVSWGGSKKESSMKQAKILELALAKVAEQLPEADDTQKLGTALNLVMGAGFDAMLASDAASAGWKSAEAQVKTASKDEEEFDPGRPMIYTNWAGFGQVEKWLEAQFGKGAGPKKKEIEKAASETNLQAFERLLEVELARPTSSPR